MSVTWSPGMLAQLACVLEVSARKPGNVHRYADGVDASHLDFLMSAMAIRDSLDQATQIGVGAAVLGAIEATRQFVATNTNMGIVLLLAPLAAIPRQMPLREGLRTVLEGLTIDDARQVYQAIRLAAPGGLGNTAEQDVASEPTVSLREAMRFAADRDGIARQYDNGYVQVFDEALPLLRSELMKGHTLEHSIVCAFTSMLGRHPDTHIARRHGESAALQVSEWARQALATEDFERLDARLRLARFNPGTTADLLTASLYVALREDTISLPIDWRREFPFHPGIETQYGTFSSDAKSR